MRSVMVLTIVNREEGLEAGGVSDNMLKFWSRDNTSALESRLVIRAVQKIKLCLAKRLVFLPRSRKSWVVIAQFTIAEPTGSTRI